MESDPMDEFMALYNGSEPVGPAAPDPAPGVPAPAGVEAPVNSAPVVLGDPLAVTTEAAIAELIRRVQAIEVYLRRNGAAL